MLKIFILLFSSAFLVGNFCLAGNPASYKLPSKAKILMKGFATDGAEADSAICRGFAVKSSEVKRMFSTYKVVSPEEIHDYYNWLPCFVEGSIEHQGKTYSFKARAGNILQTDFPDGVMRTLAGKRTTDPSGK